MHFSKLGGTLFPDSDMIGNVDTDGPDSNFELLISYTACVWKLSTTCCICQNFFQNIWENKFKLQSEPVPRRTSHIYIHMYKSKRMCFSNLVVQSRQTWHHEQYLYQQVKHEHCSTAFLCCLCVQVQCWLLFRVTRRGQFNLEQPLLFRNWWDF